MKLLKRIYDHLFPEYVTLWADKAIWDINTDIGWEWTNHAVYEVKYSIKLNKLKLVTSGYKPKQHKHYGNVVIPAWIRFLDEYTKRCVHVNN